MQVQMASMGPQMMPQQGVAMMGQQGQVQQPGSALLFYLPFQHVTSLSHT